MSLITILSRITVIDIPCLQKEQIALDPVAEKLRQQRLQEESDLMVAKDTFGKYTYLWQRVKTSHNDF